MWCEKTCFHCTFENYTNFDTANKTPLYSNAKTNKKSQAKNMFFQNSSVSIRQINFHNFMVNGNDVVFSLTIKFELCFNLCEIAQIGITTSCAVLWLMKIQPVEKFYIGISAKLRKICAQPNFTIWLRFLQLQLQPMVQFYGQRKCSKEASRMLFIK